MKTSKYSEKQKKWTQEYIQKNYDEFKIRVPKGRKSSYMAMAKWHGDSLNQFVVDLIEEFRDKNRNYEIMDYVRGDLFNESFLTEAEAVERADYLWSCMSPGDREKRDHFFVLKSVNPDGSAPDHFDGDTVKKYK